MNILPRAITVELPFPPSVNKLWRNAGRTLLSADARAFYRLAVFQIHKNLRGHKTITAPVAVKIMLYPPNRARRDLDNYAKATLDALKKAKVFTDDSLVHDLHLAWGEIKKPGKCEVNIEIFVSH